MELRDYQTAAVDAVWSYLGDNEGQPLCILPTGTGKSLVIAELIRKTVADYDGTRVLILQHVRELVRQNYAELMGVWPDAPAGIYSAGMGKRDLHSRILFASIQSIHRHAYRLQDPPVSLVIVDECHLIPRSGTTTYRKFLADLWQINPHMRVVGLTATGFRLDSGRLHVGDDAIFSDVAYEYNIRDAIDAGYLCPPVSISASAQIDTAGVGTRGGEFIAGALEDAAMDPAVVASVADEMVARGQDRKGWLAFGCGVDHCAMIRDALRERNVNCEAILGSTSGAERDSIITRFKRQEIRALVSMGVLTTGFNAPHVDLISVARPTKSTGLWIQIVGRGTRLFPGKSDCLIVDHGGNVARHGPVDDPRIKPEKTKGMLDAPAEMPTKACLNHPHCEQRSPISARECVACGCPFPDAVAKISSQASALSILSTAPRVPEWIDVSSVSYRAWPGKDGKPPTVCVSYQCGLLQHRAWHCPQHEGYARNKFVAWWREATGQTHAPLTVEDVLAMRNLIRDPVQIQVRPEGKYVAITGRRYAVQAEAA